MSHGNTKHGHAWGWGGKRGAQSPEYRAWYAMKFRCSERAKPHDKKNYYDRGISVCGRWVNSFVDFLADVGPRPSAQHSIDRKENNGDYEPRNVRWATKTEQTRNRSNTLRLRSGELVVEFCQRMGISWSAFKGIRQYYGGLSLDDTAAHFERRGSA